MEDNGELQPDESYKTSLVSQYALTKQLYEEAEGLPVGNDHTMTEDILRELQNASFNDKNLVRWKGICVKWFLEVFLKTRYMQRLAKLVANCGLCAKFA